MLRTEAHVCENETPGSPMWKLYLYQLQKEAPKPSAIFCLERVDPTPIQYGLEYHGSIHRQQCQELLMKEGNYLVRRSKLNEKHYTLSVRFSGVVKHYRLYYDGQHFVGEKKFDKLEDLLSDGLVTLYLESRASKFLLQLPSANYKQSPYFTLNRSFRQALKNNKNGKNKSSSSLKNYAVCVSSAPSIINEIPKITEKEEFLLNEKGVDEINCKKESQCDTQKLKNSENENIGCKVSSVTSLEKIDLAEDRPHRFNNHTFTGLHWCGFCGNFLWGLVLQGVKCADCSFKAHRLCSQKVPNDCCPDLKNMQSVFGMDLSTSLQKGSQESLSEDFHLVPLIVTDCIAEIEARGLLAEGIYRVSGSHDQLDTLRLAYERDPKNFSLDEKVVPDINVVAGLLKLYFRLLPLRLVTEDCFKKLLEANKLSLQDERIGKIKEILEKLPHCHYHTLKVLILHLAKVCEHSAVNKMNATSLSTIFGPTLIDFGQQLESLMPQDLLALKANAQEPRIIELLIVLHREIFLL